MGDQPAPLRLPIAPPRDSAARILLVDDDPLIRLMAGETLRAAGCEVIEAGSAEEGLALLDGALADLVLLDVILPGMNGFEACRQVRARGAHVPVIMLTGLDDAESIQAGYAAGATDFVTKPLVLDLLPYRVRYALRARRALEDLAGSQALMARAQRIANLGSWEWDAATGMIDRSEEMYRIFGTTPDHAGDGPLGLLDRVHPEDREQVRAALAAARGAGQDYRIDYRIVRPDGSQRRVYEQAETVRDEAGRIVRVQGITQDITERAEAQARIHRLAYYDSLTGLANRALFRDMVDHSLAQAERLGVHCAVLFIGLDRFRRINETLGQEIGDELLRQVARRISSSVRAADQAGTTRPAVPAEQVARLGGDEFTVLLFGISRQDVAARVATRVLEAIAEPASVLGQELRVTASAGIAVYPQDGRGSDELLRSADTAMNSAKEAGRNAVRFYRDEMSREAMARLVTENDLRRALDREELRLHYQAKVDAQTGTIVGAEGLIRWHHPQRGMVSPAEFIPVAEETGLIVPLTERVVQLACQQLGAWARRGLAPMPVSINLSAPSFRRGGLAAMLRHALESAVVDAQWLECEVTESVLMDDLGRAVGLLAELKEMGIRLALDDFGTGYSSLTYLKRFPIDVLKIDRSFVRDVADDDSGAAICSAIIAMAQQLRLEVVAEGVETREQASFLLERGCRLMQGFLYARPVAPEEFTRLRFERRRLAPPCGSAPPASAAIAVRQA